MFQLVNSIFELQADINEILATRVPNGLGQAQPMGQMSLKIENFKKMPRISIKIFFRKILFHSCTGSNISAVNND